MNRHATSDTARRTPAQNGGQMVEWNARTGQRLDGVERSYMRECVHLRLTGFVHRGLAIHERLDIDPIAGAGTPRP